MFLQFIIFNLRIVFFARFEFNIVKTERTENKSKINVAVIDDCILF